MTILEHHLEANRLRLLDVGARGGVDRRWARFESVLEAVAFEPDRDECERLQREAAALAYPVRFLPFALGSESRDEVPFHVCNWPVASSTYRPNRAFLRSFPSAERLFEIKEVRTTSTKRLDEVCREEGIRPDYLKLDVEGAELDVLLGGESALKDSLVLEIEVELQPLFEDQPQFSDVDAHLRQRGWELLGLRRNSWRRVAGPDPVRPGYGGQIVQADALYWSAAAAGGRLSLQQELKLLVTLAAYLQFDIVLDRLRSSGTVGAQLSVAELSQLERLLIPRDGSIRRIARRALGRVSAERRRALADALQQTDATVWHDPHFF